MGKRAPGKQRAWGCRLTPGRPRSELIRKGITWEAVGGLGESWSKECKESCLTCGCHGRCLSLARFDAWPNLQGAAVDAAVGVWR